MVALNYGALVLAVLLATAGASRTASAEGRVAVTVRTEKAAFLAGEPVIVLVDVRNAGTEPVTYSSGVGTIQLSVPGGAEKPVRRLTSCCMFEGVVNGTGGSTHPPVLRPGEAVTLRHLLRGYRLGPGSYRLVVSGARADIPFRQSPLLHQRAERQPRHGRRHAPLRRAWSGPHWH